MSDTLHFTSNVFSDSLNNAKNFNLNIIQPTPVQTFWDSGAIKVLAPVSVTLFVFLLGWLATIYLKKYDKQIILKTAKSSLEIWIFQLEEAIKLHNKFCNTFYQNVLTYDKMIRIDLNQIPTLVNKISEINTTEIMSYTVLNLNGDPDINSARAYKIVQSLEFLKTVESEIGDNYKLYQKTVLDLIEKWNKSNRELVAMHFKLKNEAGSNPKHPAHKFSKEVGNFFNSWIKVDRTLHENWKKKFFPPFLKLVDDEALSNPNTYASDMLMQALDLKDIMETWEVQIKYFGVLIKNYTDEYLQAYFDLKTIIQELRKQSLKDVWAIN